MRLIAFAVKSTLLPLHIRFEINFKNVIFALGYLTALNMYLVTASKTTSRMLE